MKINKQTIIIIIISLTVVSVILGLFFTQLIKRDEKETIEKFPHMPGEILVIFKEGITNKEKINIINKWNFEIIAEPIIPGSHYHLRVPQGITVREAVEKLERLKEIELAMPNFILRPPY